MKINWSELNDFDKSELFCTAFAIDKVVPQFGDMRFPELTLDLLFRIARKNGLLVWLEQGQGPSWVEARIETEANGQTEAETVSQGDPRDALAVAMLRNKGMQIILADEVK